MVFRLESDSMGTVQVPADRYWGAQTQRSLENFKIGGHRFPPAVIRAFGLVKKAAALTNCELGQLDERKAGPIVRAADDISVATGSPYFRTTKIKSHSAYSL